MPTAQDYRDSIRHRQNDKELLASLERLWSERENYQANGHTQLTMFVAAVGLFAFGRLDVVFDILELWPAQPPDKPRINARSAIRAVAELLPLPRHLDPMKVDDHASIRGWVSDHRSQLRWSEVDGRYRLNG